MILKLHLYEKGTKIDIIEITAKKANIKIGRGEECAIGIINNSISRKHCEIAIDGNKIGIKDLDSTYGTYLNQTLIGKKGKKSEQYIEVKDGDCISLGLKIDLYVECILENSEKKVCLMCGEAFQTSNPIQEFCFNCNLKMEQELGMKREEELRVAKIEASEEEVVANSIIHKKLKESSYQVTVKNPKPVLQAGEIIPGYKKIKVIGEKSPYIVYLVEERKSGKKRVIKTVTKTEINKNVFKNAYKSQKELEKQNVEVAKVYEVGEYENLLYMIMKYYESGNVVDFYHKTFKKKKYGGALVLLMKMLLSIHKLHHAKFKITIELGGETQEGFARIAHLHLNPNNFLVEADEEKNCKVLIADFGLKQEFMSKEQMQDAFRFMSREQVRNALEFSELYGAFMEICEQEGYFDSPAWDIWAAVAITYYMITGQYPRTFDTKKHPKDIVYQENVTPIWRYDYQVPAEFAKILDLALKDHGKEFYFKNAKSLIQALGKIKI